MKKNERPWRNRPVDGKPPELRTFPNRGNPWRLQPQFGRRRNDEIQNDHKRNNHIRRNAEHSRFSFKVMESLLEKPLEEVIQNLVENEHFFKYIGTKLSSDTTVMIVKLLSRFCDCAFPQLRIKILQKSLISGFLLHLQNYISNLAVQSPQDKKDNAYYWNDPDSFWKNMLRLCDLSLKEIPNFFVDHLMILVKVLLMNIPLIETEHQIHISDEIKENFRSIISRAEAYVSTRNNQHSKKREIIDDIEGEPPDDFHELSIFPTTEELVKAEKPFLRKNVVVGPYRDVEHYLDVQFRLLREDFVGPLRFAIQGHLSGKDKRDIQDIKIHRKVQFMHPVTLTEDYCVLLKFHFDGKLSNFKFEDSRKFMFGSLVCFTNDNFNSILFGRIVDRKTENLKKGELVIGFNEPKTIAFNTDYIMVEYGVYFEPYYHVLKVLQSIQEDDFPMKNYIVDIDKTVLNPRYGIPSIQYQIESNQRVKTCYPFGPGPTPTFKDLNQSQNDAFMAALSRQFTIIQGPPGTGKTHVGLKVARTLLDNSDVWFKRSPMLVICYTNHALDQFLEGLIGSTDKIVRIGGQSKNEKLADFNLKKYAHAINSAVWKAKNEVSTNLGNIKRITDNLNKIARYDSILSLKTLEEVIPNYRNSWLANATTDDFLEWLLVDGVPKNAEINIVENNGDHRGLVQKFENLKMDDPSESADEEDERINELDDLFENLEINNEKSMLELSDLYTQIRDCTEYLKSLELRIENDYECLFQYMTFQTRNNRLQQLYDFVKRKLDTAPRNIARVHPDIDAKKSRYIHIDERWNLYFHWLNLYRERLLQKHERLNLNYRDAYKCYDELKQMGNVQILSSMKVIGMTTTGAARLHYTLQLLKSPIVIVEEAAEVLEAHIVSALTKNCQQLILIGDHQQLRPNTANYKIERDYKLGISLFERMVQNDVQCFTLDTQHRMRPEISSLIKPAIYPNLKDHESVMHRPPIKGVAKCLYFIDHKVPEVEVAGTSRKNLHEAKFLVQLARYLILNGYKPHQITILAAYLGQMFEIQKMQKSTDLLKDVRVAVLDNYQGEECDIILLSLVRNNKNTIGFLSIENRVCVALSRARNGLYIMGNMSLLCDKSKLWVEINETLINQEAVGPTLSLKCQNHGKITRVSTADNFCSVAEGGCDQICNLELICGHKCKMLCHSLDMEHWNYVCTEKCNRPLCDSDPRHICRKFCGEECEPCDYPKKVTLDCEHDAVIPCHMDPEAYECPTRVEVTLPCGHDAIKPCYIEEEKFRCEVPCDARLDCGHACLSKCHVFKDPDHINYKCIKPCEKFRIGCTNLVDETHKCSLLCYQTCEPCKKIVCKARTVCPHYFGVPCDQEVDEIMCTKPCKKILDCGHKCKNECGEPCSTCKEKVKKKIPGCNHIVQLECAVEADRKYCSKKCPRILDCGHICGGLCKDDCKSYKCQEMVAVAILAECGHVVKEVPCFLKTLYNTEGISSIEGLESYCSEPCTAILNCGPEDKHPCSGSCGSCLQGRIHKRCTQKCSRILICNHQCNGFCRETCMPCSRQCSYKCKHSVCKKRCGDLCIKCKERCNRICEHQKCRARCGDICSVPPCEKPCKKKLECGHPCIGFCSDPCPQLCRICNKDEVEEVFFGTEDDEDARFVLLNDCGHVLESSGMKQWMEQKEQNKKQIGFKGCPKCKTNIFTTERYSDYIKKSIENILLAKITELGTEKQILKKREELQLKVASLRLPLLASTQLQIVGHKKRDILLDRLRTVNKDRKQSFNLVELNSMEIKYQLIKQVFEILRTSDLNEINTSLVPAVVKQVEIILNSLLREIDDITTAQIEDIQREINRLHRMVQVLPLLRVMKYQGPEIVKRITSVNKKINKLSKYDDAVDKIVKEELKVLRKQLSLLEVTDLEKQEIVKAMGLKKGHWYMCPNGHPYVITECGGAMEVGVCPQCKESIGGQNHSLLKTNKVATFMDGATHSAWSDFQNMNNYEL